MKLRGNLAGTEGKRDKDELTLDFFYINITNITISYDGNKQIFQKNRILGVTIPHLVPTLIMEYLTVSTERPDPIFQNFFMKINEWVDNTVNYQII